MGPVTSQHRHDVKMDSVAFLTEQPSLGWLENEALLWPTSEHPSLQRPSKLGSVSTLDVPLEPGPPSAFKGAEGEGLWMAALLGSWGESDQVLAKDNRVIWERIVIPHLLQQRAFLWSLFFFKPGIQYSYCLTD